jgi:hypothetical protein
MRGRTGAERLWPTGGAGAPTGERSGPEGHPAEGTGSGEAPATSIETDHPRDYTRACARNGPAKRTVRPFGSVPCRRYRFPHFHRLSYARARHTP